MTAIKNPNIPAGIYPTRDTIITLTVDTEAIFEATTQEDVIKSVTFDDNRGDGARTNVREYQSNVFKNSFITWVGAVKDVDLFPTDQVLIYKISQNAAVKIPNPSSGYGMTHVDGKAVDREFDKPQEYSISFWVQHLELGKGFVIDPKIQLHR